MIQKLRRRITWIMFSGFVLILAVLLVCIFRVSASIFDDRASVALRAALYLNETPPSSEGAISYDTALPAFRVITDDDGKFLRYDTLNADISENYARQALEAAQKTGRSTGDLSELKLRYTTRRIRGQVRYAFVDVTLIARQYGQLIYICVLLFLGTSVLFFLLARHCAKLAVQPVEETLEQQRRFIADASHELKTPLAVILADLNILNSHPAHTIGEEQKWLDSLQSETNRLKTLVEELLYLARTDQQPALRQETVNFSEILWGCLLHFESILFEAGIQMETEIQDGLLVTGDASQLQTLASILLDNACKYTPRGGKITVELSAQDRKLLLTVNNQGGEIIGPEALSHLFERFYRGDGARSSEDGGYGLGLAIGQTVVSNHGGTISAASSQEKGTTFTVQLPLSKEKAKER